MLSETRRVRGPLEGAFPEAGDPMGMSGTDARLESLETARAGLWSALQLPGLEGQAGIFARLEDMQEALVALRRDWLFSKNREVGHEEPREVGHEKPREVGHEKHRAAIATTLRDCQETLSRMELVFTFMGGLIEDRAGVASSGAYSLAQQCGGRRAQTPREGSGNWEG